MSKIYDNKGIYFQKYFDKQAMSNSYFHHTIEKGLDMFFIIINYIRRQYSFTSQASSNYATHKKESRAV